MLKMPKLCYLCGQPVKRSEGSREHVLPKGWFAQEDRKDLITVLAHASCNGSYAQDDEYFRLCVTSIAAAQDPAAQKLFDGPVMRGFHRPDQPGLKRSVLAKLQRVDVQSDAGIYLGTADAMLADATRLRRVVNRIARGLYTHHTGKVLPADWPVGSELMPSEGAATLPRRIGMRLVGVGNGTVLCSWKHLKDDDREGILWLVFYRSVHFYAFTGAEIRSRMPW